MTNTDARGRAMVDLKAVTKLYNDYVALAETTLEVREGEFLTLLGPSGSGKTTLLNMICGMQMPTTGRIFIDGRDVTDVPPSKRKIGMVFQNYALMPHMTVFENIAFPLQIRKVSKQVIRQRVMKVLALVGLEALEKRRPRELSGGQQQRVSIARCMVYDPSLILMDEPLGALDKKLREQMQIEIKRLHRDSGITIVYVTHDQEEALNMSDRIMLMNRGQIEQLGTPDELYSAPRTQFAADFIGESSLLDAEVVDAGNAGRVRLLSSHLCVAVIKGAAIGARGKLLLRPETVRMGVPDDIPQGHNSIGATVSSTLTTGGTTKHYASIDGSGEQVIVQELSGALARRYQPGQPVQITWPAEAGLFLEH
ncbi:ABC transporter ATP-binding protein [Agrobacterium vitis]|uniref:ABC transporter ATP-binding protein n=1 Tax=Allorhizobium ampelinum TaxID=3025782 RepID=UPI001F1A88D5|nr:ABC transporter ATP-binding protein [Allorhizobium ampelinum]MCF1464596.1 ABC transporter ATP-binding protein [Allorhizobium ampelinum]